MPYLVAADLPTAPPANASARFMKRPASCNCPARTTHGGAPGSCGRFRRGVSLRAAMTARWGLPDLASSRSTTLLLHPPGRARLGLPVLADGDTGYGEALNVMHMVRAFEEAAPGRSISRPDPSQDNAASERQEACRSARHGGQGRRCRQGATASLHRRPHRRRSGAKASTAPWPAPALSRGRRRRNLPEALTNAEMFRAFARRCRVSSCWPHDGVRSDAVLTADEFEGDGYKMVIWPVSSLRVANKAQGNSTPTQARRWYAELACRHAHARQL